MTDEWTKTRNNERIILRRVVEVLAADPRINTVAIDDGCDDYERIMKREDMLNQWPEIEAACFAVDDVTLVVVPLTRDGDTISSFVQFIWNNGDEGLTCISDYGVSLEETLKPVNAMIDTMESA